MIAFVRNCTSLLQQNKCIDDDLTIDVRWFWSLHFQSKKRQWLTLSWAQVNSASGQVSVATVPSSIKFQIRVGLAIGSKKISKLRTGNRKTTPASRMFFGSHMQSEIHTTKPENNIHVNTLQISQYKQNRNDVIRETEKHFNSINLICLSIYSDSIRFNT